MTSLWHGGWAPAVALASDSGGVGWPGNSLRCLPPMRMLLHPLPPCIPTSLAILVGLASALLPYLGLVPLSLLVRPESCLVVLPLPLSAHTPHCLLFAPTSAPFTCPPCKGPLPPSPLPPPLNPSPPPPPAQASPWVAPAGGWKPATQLTIRQRLKKCTALE